jgi:hypothetical protein
MVAPTDVCNQALSQMGSRAQVSSINPSDGSPAGDACSLLYTPRIQALLRAAHWNQARWQEPLTLLKAAAGTPPNVNGTTLPIPPLGFLYEYAYPSRCLAARFVIPTPLPQPAVSPPLTTGPIQVMPFARLSVSVPFVVALDTNTQTPPARTRVILTNAYTAQLVYTTDVSDEPDLWDPSFTDAAVAYMAAWLVSPLNMKASLIQERSAIVKELVLAARLSDGNEGVTPNDHVPDWLMARTRTGGASFSSYENGANYMGSWSVLGLPGGISF